MYLECKTYGLSSHLTATFSLEKVVSDLVLCYFVFRFGCQSIHVHVVPENAVAVGIYMYMYVYMYVVLCVYVVLLTS